MSHVARYLAHAALDTHPEYTEEERYRLYVCVPQTDRVALTNSELRMPPRLRYQLVPKGTCPTPEAAGLAMQTWAEDAREGVDEWQGGVYVLDGLHRQWLTSPPVGAR